MKTAVIFNSDLHFEHKVWINEILFWRDELKLFNKRLDEIVKRWTDKNILKQLGHFQNQFYIHTEVLDSIKDDIEKHELNIARYSAIGKDEVLDTVLVKKHIDIRDKMETQKRMYSDLKKEFFNFLTKYM